MSHGFKLSPEERLLLKKGRVYETANLQKILGPTPNPLIKWTISKLKFV